MPWQVADKMDKRIEFVARSQEEGVNFSALCREFGISRPTGYLWKKRYQEVGSFTQLQKFSRRPHHSPNHTSSAIENQVLHTWKDWGDGAKKIQVTLAAKGIQLPWITIHRILKRHGKVISQTPTGSAPNRFERKHPNELWQMDFKGEYAMRGGRCYPLSILDDCSRFAVGLYGLNCQKGVGVWDSLVQTFERHGVPQAMLVDHGTPWWSTTNGHGLTWVTVKLIKQGIRLYYSRVRHPQTQGKVERFHRTLNQAVHHRGLPTTLKQWQQFLEEFRTMYNEKRAHEALGMDVPAHRFSPSPCVYNPNPPEWEYPAGSHLTRITSSGWISYKGCGAFVCEALAGELVQVQEVDSLFLVRYRHLFIREVDMQTKESRPLILHAQSINTAQSPSTGAGVNDEDAKKALSFRD